MKGIVIDCKTGITEEIDDGLPMPEVPVYVEPEGLDLVEAAKKLKGIDQIKADLEEIKRKLK